MRLQRRGKKKFPTYRIVATDSRCTRDGVIIDTIGHYNPCKEPSVLEYDSEKVKYWCSNGAQATDPVLRLLCSEKDLLPAKQVNAYKRRLEIKLKIRKEKEAQAKKEQEAKEKAELDAKKAEENSAEDNTDS